jgi:hypothetical protein
MAGRLWVPVGPASVVAILAAAGLGIWSADRAADALGVGRSERADRGSSHRTAERVAAPGSAPMRYVSAPSLTFGGAGLQPKGGALPETQGGPIPAPGPEAAGEVAADDAERIAAAALTEGLRKLARDLEYNASAGLREPPQQTVIAPPAPWRPPVAAASAPAPVIEALEPASAPVAGGERVVIRGQFLRPAQVMFGSAPAQVLTASAGSVAVVAPRGAAGRVTVAVTNDDGTFAVAAQPFTYLAP